MSNLISYFFRSAALLLVLGCLFGVLSAAYYVVPGSMEQLISFESLRPLHVSSILFWILLAATGSVFFGITTQSGRKPVTGLLVAQFLFWWGAMVVVYFFYFRGIFGGREYWEFPPPVAALLAIAWLIFLAHFFYIARKIQRWPVYTWMWMTGIIFFIFTFAENYLWLFPYFRQHFITDMTIQWKVNGSVVGAWNQLVYGTAFFVMDRITGSTKTGFSKKAFFMYFLGLFNLMFNWGHHIYNLPNPGYIRYTGYIVSMTEWIIFISIIRDWRKTMAMMKLHPGSLSFKLLMAADVWVFINLFQALLMSVPAINKYTHGTHITVAHAMGTTIGINTMILMAAGSEYFQGARRTISKFIHRVFYITQVSFLVFWISLLVAGVEKGIWMNATDRVSFSVMMQNLTPVFWVFTVSGICLAVCLVILVVSICGKGPDKNRISGIPVQE